MRRARPKTSRCGAWTLPERITSREALEATEVPVSGQQLGYAVLEAERGDMRVVHQVAKDPGSGRSFS